MREVQQQFERKAESLVKRIDKEDKRIPEVFRHDRGFKPALDKVRTIGMELTSRRQTMAETIRSLERDVSALV